MDRFWNKVDKLPGVDSCWLWTASTDRYGYGQFKLDGRVRRAHQVSWKLEKGEWPSYLCHTCHNRSCVNPSHLYEGNHVSNGRDRRDRCISSGEHDDHMILRIRRVYALGISSTHISKQLSLSKRTVLDILNGKTYRGTGGPIRDKSLRTYGNRFKSSQTENPRSAARFLTRYKNRHK